MAAGATAGATPRPSSTSTGLWVRGYDAIETNKGKRRVYSSDPCSRRAGSGRVHY